jgi:DNA polymerase-3 subunit gamma/tau
MRELHLERRPTSFKQVIGQPEAIQQLTSLAKGEGGIPHFLLFTGTSGCGKTTLARIVRNKLKCGDQDFVEINAAENRGIEMVRGLQARINLAPISGRCRVWLVDEAHQLTADAQGAFLKLLEEPPDHAYIMLATTNPEKLRKAIRTRATEIKVRDLTDKEATGLVVGAAGDSDVTLDAEVVTRLVEVAEGSARKALVLLQQIMGIEDTATQLNALQSADSKAAAIEIARAIMGGKGWGTVSKILKGVTEEPEGLRWMVLSYFTSVALGGRGDAGRAVSIIKCFECNYYDSKRAGLVASCFDACQV